MPSDRDFILEKMPNSKGQLKKAARGDTPHIAIDGVQRAPRAKTSKVARNVGKSKKIVLYSENKNDEASNVTDRSSGSGVSSPSSSAPTSPFYSEPQNKQRLRHYEGKFQNRREQSLFYFSLFPPEKEPMRAIILCLHGIGDHCRRNISLYKRLCKEGYGVITYDMLNHGASDIDGHKTRAHISDFNHLVDDTNDFITFAKRSIYTDALRYWRKHHHRRHPHGKSVNIVSLPELPLIIMGISFGSLVGLHTVLTGQHKFHAAVWASPTIGVTWTPLLFAQSLLPLAPVIPKARVVPAINHELLCRDAAFLETFRSDPLTCTDKMTAKTANEALNAMLQLQKDKRVTEAEHAFSAIPMLFLAGSNDGIADQQAAIRFFASMGSFDKEFKLIDGAFHYVFEDIEKRVAIGHLSQWLRKRFPLETRNSSALEARR